MLTHLGLRLRIFLLFLFLAVAGVGLVIAALTIGFFRLEAGREANAFFIAGIAAGFGLVGLTAGVWLLFDENVAKPIERLAATMRARADAGVDVEVDAHHARYLGDLAPAAQAVAGQLSRSTMDVTEAVASETARLAAEKQRLTALLSQMPMAIVLISPSHQIVLYDAQAAAVLGQVHVPRLNASIFDFFDRDDVLSAHAELVRSAAEVSFTARGSEGHMTFDIRLKPLGHAPGYMMFIDSAQALIAPEEARPLTYDFDLLGQAFERAMDERPIQSLNFVVFDTETTGLAPHKDEIVQIGAVRVVNGRIVPGETIDQLVNPGMAIPPASTKVHKVTDAMVADAPDICTASRRLHQFARDSVIVAHNAPFDMSFLRRHEKAAGIVWDHPILDTVLLSAVLFGASETHTLDALCDRLSVTIAEDERHTALGDARATAAVLCKMLPMLESRDIRTFGDVIAQTRKHGRLLQDLN